MSTEELLRVEDLTVHYTTLIGDVKAAEDIYFTLQEGQTLGLAG
ncbi:ABC transporter ATP-binding protein, partial [Candidatus Bathyarchaeota archaeon]